jgi:hypothetical protein
VLHNSRPPLTAATNRHNDTAPPARQAAAIAASASPAGVPVGSIRDRRASSANAQPVKCARILSRRRTNRPSQPRTVERGSPNSRAIRRRLQPPTESSSTRPIVSTASPRRNSINAGNSTCVSLQSRQRDRRGRTRRACHARPTVRSLAHPHGANTPQHDGHCRSPDSSCNSTTDTSTFTVSTAAPRSTRGPPVVLPDTCGRASPQFTPATLPAPQPTQQPTPLRDQPR